MKEMNLEDILIWIIKNSEDRKAMDKINEITFQFTTKYAEKFGKRV